MSGTSVQLETVQGSSAVAFAGIAHPVGFFDSLRRMGIRLMECVGFPDHYQYTAADVAWLMEKREQTGARYLITTEKDIVRLPDEIQPRFLVMDLELDFGEQAKDLCRFLDERLVQAGVSP
jgi:tetraacyldisaccharide 4'-kinase